MKWFVSVLAGLVFFYACTPSHDKPSTPTDPVFVVSQLDSMTRRVHTDKGYFTTHWAFTYDAKGRLIQMDGPETDTAPDGYLNPSFDINASFIYKESDSVPSGYTIKYKGLNVSDQPTEYYTLMYSGGTLVSDSMTDLSYGTFTHFYFYPGKAYRLVSNSGPEDSVYFDKENMTADSTMAAVDNGNGTVRFAPTWQIWSYGADQNPLYLPAFATARLALFFDLGFDFGSPNVVSTTTFIGDPTATLTWNYSWVKDSQGRITEGTAVDARDGTVQDHVLFTYKK